MAKTKTAPRSDNGSKGEELTPEQAYVLRAIRAVPDAQIAKRFSISIGLLKAKSRDWGIKRLRGVPPDPIQGRFNELWALLEAADNQKTKVEMLDAAISHMRSEFGVVAYVGK